MFTAESDSERILKIGQHLPKLWAIKCRVVFYESPYRRMYKNERRNKKVFRRCWNDCSVVLMHWRRFPAVCSRWRKRQPEKLGCQQWKVWPTPRLLCS